jgi:hypothetical protein
MENFIHYLLKSSAILALLYGCYFLFLRKETLFISNRVFFLIGIVLSLSLPWITFTETVLLPYTPTENMVSVTETTLVSNAKAITFSWMQLIIGLYTLGCLFFGLRLLLQFTTLYKLKKISQITLEPPYRHIKTPKPIAPFSFFNSIFYYPKTFSDKELATIIRHEKVHAAQKHSLDIILVELLFIIQWFNPFIWLYKNHLKQNLEFLADEACQTSDRKFYQMLLLKEAVGVTNIPLSTSFYNSIIKKRIVMLNQKRSKKINFTKSLIVLPVLALFLMAFNTKTIYQVSERTTQQSNDIELVIEKNTQNQTLDIIKNVLLEKKIDFSYTAVRNETLEIIALELDMKDISNDDASNYNAYYKSTSTGPIASVVIKLNPITKRVTIGEGNATKSTNEAHTVVSTVTDIKIEMNKDSKEEIYTKNQKFLKEKGVEIDFKGVKRNEKNEITAIKVFYDNGAGLKGNYVRNSDNPIDPFVIIIKFHQDIPADILITKKGPWIIEPVAYSEIAVAADETETTHSLKSTQITLDSNEIATESVRANPVSIKTIKIRTENNTNIILLDDKEVSLEELEKESEAVRIFAKSINRLESYDSITGKTTIEQSKFKNSTGNEVEITRIETGVENEMEYRITEELNTTLSPKTYELEEIIAVGGKAELTRIKYGEVIKEPLIIIDDIKVNREMKDINPNSIKSINVLKGKSAIKKYGEEGKNGVIEITTKKE